MPTNKEEWCWREKDSETAFGPFPSREEAIEEARGSSDSRVVSIGRCIYPDPVYTAGAVIDLDSILESMEEFVYDNGFPFDDSVFDLKSAVAKEAQEALKQAVRDWAQKYLDQPTAWHTSEQEEEVVINPPDKSRPICHCGEYCDEHSTLGSGHTAIPMEEADDDQ